jgi:hypothetical protein
VKLALWLAGLLALIVATILNRWLESTFVGRALLYIDMFACALLLSDPDMTISARCGLALKAGGPGYLCALGRVLNVIQKHHTDLAIANDIRRARNALDLLLSE